MQEGVQRSEERSPLAGRLQQIHARLDVGDVESARYLAHEELEAAVAGADSRGQAGALLALAECDRFSSRFRRAHDASQRAAHLYSLVGDVEGEASALATMAYTATNLGHTEEAVEAALLGVELTRSLPPVAQRVLSYSDLGMAYMWARSYAGAEAAFAAAINVAAQCQPPVSSLQTRLDQLFAEMYRLVCERRRAGPISSAAGIARCLEAADDAAQSPDRSGMRPGAPVVLEAMRGFGRGLALCWMGKLADARATLEAASAAAQLFPRRNWLRPLEHWVRAEILIASSEWQAAQISAQCMVDAAVEVEHEQFACLGHLVASQIFETQERFADAVEQLRLLRDREQAIRAEGLESRRQVVRWRLDLRGSQESLQRVQSESRILERLSFEDTLTRIPNRRHFEQQLQRALEGLNQRKSSFSMALIDVDRFKQINDGYSHLVGDQVLVALASIMRAQLRERDLVARFAGDEFAALLDGADESTADAVCDRICTAVDRYDWDTIAPGLHVSISIGTTRARAGDTAPSLLERSDGAMYAHKATRSNSG